MPMRYRLCKVVDSTELCAFLNGASLKIDSPTIVTNPDYCDNTQLLWRTPIIMTNPNYYDKLQLLWLHIYYDSKEIVSPKYGHLDCTILYHFYNLNCKHRSRTFPNYVKCYASLLIVPCYEKKCIILWWKTKSHNKDVVRPKNIWKLSNFELHRKALRISYLSFTAWWLNQQDNNNNNKTLH